MTPPEQVPRTTPVHRPRGSDPHEVFSHTERADGIARVGPLVALGVAAGFAGVIAFATGVAATWLIPLALLAFGAWWVWGAAISVTVYPDRVRFRAPLVSRTLPRAQLSDVSVTADDGMNPGAINWPAAPVTIHGARMLRFSMGGAAAITVRTAAGSAVQFVARDRHTAQRITAALAI